MRSFAAYILYFRGDKQLSGLALILEQDMELPSAINHEVLYRYFMNTPKYSRFHSYIEVLYGKYLRNLNVKMVK